MTKYANSHPNLIFVYGDDDDRYYMRDAHGVRLRELAAHTKPDESYKLNFRNIQSTGDINRKIEEFRQHGIRVDWVSAPVYRDFDVSSDGKLIEP